MSRFRFSIASLLGLVFCVAIAIAALGAASDVWDGILLTATVGVLLVAVLLAVHRTCGGRAFWLGFALFGCAYLVASLVPSIESRLITTKGLAYLDSKIPARKGHLIRLSLRHILADQNFALGELDLTTDDHLPTRTNGAAIRLWDAATGKLLSGSGGTPENFVRIGHCLIALMLAFLGGKLSRYLSVSRQQRSRDVPENLPLPSLGAGQE